MRGALILKSSPSPERAKFALERGVWQNNSYSLIDDHIGRKECWPMADDLLNLQSPPDARYLIAGWRRQWSDGGEISSGLPRYLIEKLQGRRIGSMGADIAKLCYVPMSSTG